MSKVRIKIVTLGHMPAHFNKNKIANCESILFEINNVIDDYPLTCDSDIPDYWAFSDNLISAQLPSCNDADILIAITSVPLQYDWYLRRLNENKVVFTFHMVKDLLKNENIPLENVVYRVLYASSLTYKGSGDRAPSYDDILGFMHDETKGCLFDMNGLKTDLIESCDKPIICKDCEHKLSTRKIPTNLIETVKKELKGIRKTRYYRWADFIKSHPIISLAISLFSVVLFGVLSSVIASILYDKFIKNWFV
ncbi:hypothetical protein J8657_11975 [Dickeya oryzae]|uniref:Uncharacterized protein n=1 Tax=Dickeya oryzae TaxID=1240404 RepID=A0ABS5BCZ5_9GAMM|nr:hypothetical protein [Dickeya oryzae]MBP2858316.1 hypothetical protein [Dickeya oryzae]